MKQLFLSKDNPKVHKQLVHETFSSSMRNFYYFLIIVLCLTACGRSRMVSIKLQPEYITALQQSKKIIKKQPIDKSLKFTLVEEFERKNGHCFAQYEVGAHGLAPGMKLHLHSYYTGYSPRIDMQVTTDTQGTLREILTDGQLAQTPLIITVDALPGARTWLILTSYESKNRFELAESITPHPLSISAEDGAQMELSRIEKAANFVYIELRNFKPNELVVLTSISGQEIRIPIVVTDSTGYGAIVLDPGVLNKKEAEAAIILTRNSNQYEINYRWSEEDWTRQDYSDYELVRGKRITI